MVEEFKAKLLNDTELLNDLPLLRNQLINERVLRKLNDLCRDVYLIQYEAGIFRDGNELKAFYPNETFEVLGNQISNFIRSIEGKNNEILDEVMLILKKYYIETAIPAEKNSEISKLINEENKNGIGFVATLYNFNKIDWNRFSEVIMDNIDLEYPNCTL